MTAGAKKPDDTPPDDELLAGKYKTSEELVKGYENLESSAGKDRSRREKLEKFLGGYGYTTDAEGNVIEPPPNPYAPPEPPVTPPGQDPYALAPEDPDPQAKITALEAQVKGQGQIIEQVTRSQSDLAKDQYLKDVPAEQRKEADKIWDELTGGMTPETRIDPGALNAARDIVWGRLAQKGPMVTTPPTPPAAGDIPDTSDPGSDVDDGGAPAPLSPLEAEVHRGMKSAGVKISEKDYAAGLKKERARRKRAT